MSTKVTLKLCEGETGGEVAHLYEECLAVDDSRVYLSIRGVTEMSVDLTPQGTTMTLSLSRDLATKLGLLRLVER